MMENTNDYILKKALSQLPDYKTAVSWDDFQHFEENTKLRIALEKLPEYTTEVEWHTMQIALQKPKVSWVKPISRVAASLMLLVSIWLVFELSKSDSTHSVEVIAQRLDYQSESNKEYAMLIQNLPEVTKTSSNVKQLQKEFEQLATDQKDLESVLSMYETDTQLIQEWVKIENEKASLLNELAHYI